MAFSDSFLLTRSRPLSPHLDCVSLGFLLLLDFLSPFSALPCFSPAPLFRGYDIIAPLPKPAIYLSLFLLLLPERISISIFPPCLLFPLFPCENVNIKKGKDLKPGQELLTQPGACDIAVYTRLYLRRRKEASRSKQREKG